jgi:hypothetical protein
MGRRSFKFIVGDAASFEDCRLIAYVKKKGVSNDAELIPIPHPAVASVGSLLSASARYEQVGVLCLLSNGPVEKELFKSVPSSVNLGAE